MNIQELLNGKALLFANRIMYETFNAEQYTFSQIKEQTIALQNALYYYGVRKGDKVAILSEDNPQWNIAFFAITMMGAVVVPVSKYNNKSVLHGICSLAECNFLLLQRNLLSDTTFNSLKEDTPLTIIDISTYKCILSSKIKIEKKFKTHDNNNSLTMPYVDINSHDLAAAKVEFDFCSQNIIYYTHEELVLKAKEQAINLELSDNDTLVSVLPISFSYRKIISVLVPLFNANLMIFKPSQAGFNTIVNMINEKKPTVILTVPKALDVVYSSNIVDKKIRNLIDMNRKRLSLLSRFKFRIQGSKIYKILGGKVRLCSLDETPKNLNLQRFLNYSGLKFKMKFRES